jgi:pimeloyl-ACP methyl ester carboxylesterase
MEFAPAMWMALTFLLPLLLQNEPAIELSFRRLSPESEERKGRAVVLINGFLPVPFKRAKAESPVVPGWLAADSELGRALAAEGDLYGFSYSQNAAVELIPAAKGPDDKGLAEHVAALRAAGYREVVLVGFSAGALIARHFVEDHPDSGVTKAIQICPPNGGTGWGKANAGVTSTQEPFLNSMSRERRSALMEERKSKRIPDGVEFVVVVGNGAGSGDLVVTCESQWPQDLQAQGVPAVVVSTLHLTATRSSKVAAKVAELVRNRQSRWSKGEVEQARARILE